MQLLTSYVNAPGHCRLCQSCVTPVVDTQRDYDSDGFGGVLYICQNCVGTLASLMGWVHPSSKIDYENDIADRNELIDRLEVESADMAAELATLKDTFAILSTPAAAPVKRGPGRPRKADS